MDFRRKNYKKLWTRYRGMSRRYKKTPIVKDGQDNAGSRKWWKRQANKKSDAVSRFREKNQKILEKAE